MIDQMQTKMRKIFVKTLSPPNLKFLKHEKLASPIRQVITRSVFVGRYSENETACVTAAINQGPLSRERRLI
jgi:hypothetical protein